MDGRTFTGHLPLDTPMLVGGMVLVSTPSQTRLGQVVEKVVEGHRVAVRGLLLAALDPGPVLRPLVPAPFAGASLDPASADVLVAHQAMVGADLPVATLSVDGAEVPARLRSRGFNRHTFLCGQSGSGKTYALGVLLERLLLGTGLRMVVVDPNADYVHLGRQREGIDPAVVDRLRESTVRVLRAVAPGEQVHEPDPLGAEPLVTLFPELSPAAKSALIGLDPLRDRNEYTLMLDLVERMRSGEVDDLESELLTSPDPAAMALAQRMHNLGVDRWTLWAQGRTPLREVVDAGARATVLDLSGFSTSTERSAATVALLDHLWEQRESRVPTLIVIDEAHNVCSAEPEDKVQALATERL
ncbi:MAG: ATP-binding protein, partial [Cellulomonadaceae bacterium]|nr:ATP-binding protein [Cellulomonadaceae bacterium]